MTIEQQPASPVSPADLEIRVTTPWGGGEQSVDLVLHSASGKAGFHHRRVAGKAIRHPEQFQKQLFEQLEKLHSGVDVGNAAVLRDEVLGELVSIGHDLYQMLFSREMRAIYREVRDKVTSLVITSDEPWIPWELLRPAELPGDDFLCMKFQMGRWLSGDVPLASGKKVRRLLCVEAVADEAPKLEGAADERHFLRQFCGAIPGIDGAFPRAALQNEVTLQIEQGCFDLIHFAGHGEHDDSRPAEARVLMPDRSFRVRHLSPEVERKLREERPLVFFNACQVGRLEHSLSGLDGWAARWVRRCGCSAFLAPLWSVHDTRARRFAELFYHRLYQGHPLGEAVQAARHQLRSEEPGEMTWLAYSLYGHPNARVVFGDHRPELVDASSSGRDPRRPGRSQISSAIPGVGAPTPVTAQSSRGPRPIDPGRSPGHQQAKPGVRRWLGISVAGLALVGALGLGLEGGLGGFRDEPMTGGDIGQVEAKPPGNEPKSDHRENGMTPESGVGSEERLDPTKDAVVSRLDTPPPSPPPPVVQKPLPAFPFATLVPGKVAILVLDNATRRPDFEVAEAVRSVLDDQAEGTTTVTPRISDPGFVESWLGGDYSNLSEGGRTPWGAEHLLLATARRKTRSDPNPNFEGITLTLTTQLIDSGHRAVALRSSETHNGLGISIDVALQQAAERCLREITGVLREGGSS